MMNSEEALEVVEQILPPGTLTSIKVVVFHRSWNGKEYITYLRS
jgi:hypothetical protein